MLQTITRLGAGLNAFNANAAPIASAFRLFDTCPMSHGTTGQRMPGTAVPERLLDQPRAIVPVSRSYRMVPNRLPSSEALTHSETCIPGSRWYQQIAANVAIRVRGAESDVLRHEAARQQDRRHAHSQLAASRHSRRSTVNAASASSSSSPSSGRATAVAPSIAPSIATLHVVSEPLVPLLSTPVEPSFGLSDAVVALSIAPGIPEWCNRDGRKSTRTACQGAHHGND